MNIPISIYLSVKVVNEQLLFKMHIKNIDTCIRVCSKLHSHKLGAFLKGGHGPEGEAWDAAPLAGLTTWEGRWEPLSLLVQNPSLLNHVWYFTNI